jgi:hypothetical protein
MAIRRRKSDTCVSSVSGSFVSSVTTSSSSNSEVFIPSVPADVPAVSDDVAKKAVLNHLRYLRSLGKNRISTADVARSLSLPLSQVKRAAVKVGAVIED